MVTIPLDFYPGCIYIPLLYHLFGSLNMYFTTSQWAKLIKDLRPWGKRKFVKQENMFLNGTVAFVKGGSLHSSKAPTRNLTPNQQKSLILNNLKKSQRELHTSTLQKIQSCEMQRGDAQQESVVKRDGTYLRCSCRRHWWCGSTTAEKWRSSDCFFGTLGGAKPLVKTVGKSLHFLWREPYEPSLSTGFSSV